MMTGTSITAQDVSRVFDSYDARVRAPLLELRRLILSTAEDTEGVGAIHETLKWGQPSYLTSETGSGSTIRIAPTAQGSDFDYAMFFICRTSLVEQFQALFGASLSYEGQRALVFSVGDALPVAEVRECVRMALTYHR